MRARKVVTVSLVAVITATLGFAFALWRTGARGESATGTIRVDVASMRPGSVKALSLDIDALYGARWPVFVVDDQSGHLNAYLGRAQGVACPLVWSGEPGYTRMVTIAAVAFEDPCGGALFAIDGACLDGPCTHSLDQFAVTRSGAGAVIRLNTLIRGRPGRGAI